jgi:cephalosporin-C deacetylase
MTHDLPFDPTYGHDLTALMRVGAPDDPPADFEEFWRGLYRRTLGVKPRATAREIEPIDGGATRVFEIEYDSLDGFRVGGWLTLPTAGKPTSGLVVGHGYGGRGNPDVNDFTRGAAAIFPCGRGFDRSARPGLPNVGSTHVLHGIASRDTYVHGKCAADIWAAVSALVELAPGLSSVNYAGVSFGGGVGALALPWEPRFRRAFLDVPSFGNHPLRLTLQCTGSGEFVRRYHRRHPEVTAVLSYFDAATAASHVRAPTLVAAALFDPAVPPPGQFAVYNAIPGPKKVFVRMAGHFAHPGEAAENEAVERTVKEWFDAKE